MNPHGSPDVQLTPAQRGRLTPAHYPRSARYDPGWVIDNLMGPNALWLVEALTDRMALKPGMRVLDLGCGKAITSIFLAREFGVQVWATDLWIPATDNARRIQAAGVADLVFPLHAEAHQLPYANDFFDAVVSIDAYHYFGTSDLYLRNHLAPLLRAGASFGMVAPAVRTAFAAAAVPEHLAPYWEPDFASFHTPDWWAENFSASGTMQNIRADLLPHGAEDWQRFMEVCAELPGASPGAARERDMLAVDAGRNVGFVRIVGDKVAQTST